MRAGIVICVLLSFSQQALPAGFLPRAPAACFRQQPSSELKKIKSPPEASYQVALLYPGYANAREGYLCAGSLISPEWIVTAAHCFSSRSKPSDFRVAAGSTQLSQSRLIPISKIVRHEGFDPNSMVNDIALIRLATPVVIEKPLELAGFAIEEQALKSHGLATVSGWGARGFHERKVSDELLSVIVPIRSRQSCNSSYKGAVTNEMLCAGGKNADVCFGDSGAGLVITYNDQSYLEGIVSWGEGCGKPNKPGVYTRIPSYLDWIKSHMN